MKGTISNARVPSPRFPAGPVVFCVLCVAGCVIGAAPSASAEVGISTSVLTVDQVYSAPRYRDPFVVSTVFGDEHAPKGRGRAGVPIVSTFNVHGLSLTGIIEYNRTKEALLSDKVSGQVYVLKSGRLLDARKKQVPGIAGVIRGKQVVLMTSEKEVHQLSLHEKSSGEEK